MTSQSVILGFAIWFLLSSILAIRISSLMHPEHRLFGFLLPRSLRVTSLFGFAVPRKFRRA